MATSTKQVVATVPVYDYLQNPGDALLTSAPALQGRRVKVTLAYDKARSIAPVTWLENLTVYSTLTDPNGFWQVNVVPTDNITPSGTYYIVEVEGYLSYKINPIAAGIPALGWQSSAILLDVPGPLATAGGTIAGPITITGGLNLTPGETGLDTSAPGPLLIGDNVATSIELGAISNVPALQVLGLTGAVAGTRMVGATAFGAPTSGTFQVGDYVISQATGAVIVCSVAGTPGAWIYPLNIFNIRDFGAKGDQQTVADGAMGLGSAVLTSVSGKFVSTDVGKYITVAGGAAAGATLATTILSFQSPTQVTLNASNASGGAISAKSVFWASDDGPACGLAEAAAAVAFGTVYYPPPPGGAYWIETTVTLKSGVTHLAARGSVTLKRTVAGDFFVSTAQALDSVTIDGLTFDCVNIAWSAIDVFGSDANGQVTNLTVRNCNFKNPSITWMVQISYTLVDPAIPTLKNRNIRIEDCYDDATGGTFSLENIIFVNSQDVFVSGCRFLNTPASLAAHVACYGYCRNVRFIGNYVDSWVSSRAVYCVQSDSISFVGDQFRITTNHTVAEIFNCRDVKFLGCQMVTGNAGNGVVINDFGGATFDGHTNLYTFSSGIAVQDCRMDVMAACVTLNLQGIQGQTDIQITGCLVSPLRSLFQIQNMPAAPSATVQRISITDNQVASHSGFSGGAALIELAGNAAATLGGVSGVVIKDNEFAASAAGGSGTDIEILNKADDITITGNRHYGSATPIVGLALATNARAWNNPGADANATGTLGVSALSALGQITFGGHLVSTATGTPTTSNLGANVTSVTFTGNDTRGTIAIVMSAGLAANTRVATCTFAVSYGATGPKITLVDQTSTAGLAIVNSYVLAQSTGVSFDLAFDQALVAGTYIVDYICIG